MAEWGINKLAKSSTETNRGETKEAPRKRQEVRVQSSNQFYVQNQDLKNGE